MRGPPGRNGAAPATAIHRSGQGARSTHRRVGRSLHALRDGGPGGLQADVSSRRPPSKRGRTRPLRHGASRRRCDRHQLLRAVSVPLRDSVVSDGVAVGSAVFESNRHHQTLSDPRGGPTRALRPEPITSSAVQSIGRSFQAAEVRVVQEGRNSEAPHRNRIFVGRILTPPSSTMSASSAPTSGSGGSGGFPWG